MNKVVYRVPEGLLAAWDNVPSSARMHALARTESSGSPPLLRHGFAQVRRRNFALGEQSDELPSNRRRPLDPPQYLVHVDHEILIPLKFEDQQFADYRVAGTAVMAKTSTSRLLGKLMLRTTLFVSKLKE